MINHEANHHHASICIGSMMILCDFISQRALNVALWFLYNVLLRPLLRFKVKPWVILFLLGWRKVGLRFGQLAWCHIASNALTSYPFCSRRWSPRGPRVGPSGRWWTWHSKKRWTEVGRCHHKMSPEGSPRPPICRCRSWCSRKRSRRGTPARSGERWAGRRSPRPPRSARSSRCCRGTGPGSWGWRCCRMEPPGFLHIWHLIIKVFSRESGDIKPRVLHLSVSVFLQPIEPLYM